MKKNTVTGNYCQIWLPSVEYRHINKLSNAIQLFCYKVDFNDAHNCCFFSYVVVEELIELYVLVLRL